MVNPFGQVSYNFTRIFEEFPGVLYIFKIFQVERKPCTNYSLACL